MTEAMSRLNDALRGRYTIEQELGEGGKATVYLAADLKHQRKVALKVLKQELAAVVGAERFLAEIKTTANLSAPSYPAALRFRRGGRLPLLRDAYVEGESLREKLDREHQLPVEDAVRIASDVAEALEYAHTRHLEHTEPLRA